MADLTINGATLHFVERLRVKHRLNYSTVYRRLVLLHGFEPDTVPVYLSTHFHNFAIVISRSTTEDTVNWHVSPDVPDALLLAGLDAFGEWFDEDMQALDDFMSNIGKAPVPVDQDEIEKAAEEMALAMLGQVPEGDDAPEDDRPFTYDAGTLTTCWYDLTRRNMYPESGGYFDQDAELLSQVHRFGAKIARYKDAFENDELLPSGAGIDVEQFARNGTALGDLTD